MKKLMILTAVVALAFGAQAKVYTFTFQLANIPKQGEDGHPDHDFIYLADNNKQVICYVDRGTLEGVTPSRSGDMSKDADGNWSLRGSSISHDATSGSEYKALAGKTVLDHTLSAATIKKTGVGVNERTFSVTFETEYDIDGHVTWLGQNQKSGEVDGLRVVVTNSQFPDTTFCDEYMYDDKLGASRTFEEGASGYTITGGARYPVPAVPEPTSAMLLLLGVAGLALKRKVA